MLRQLVCAIAVTGLVAGCSGGDDKGDDNSSSDPSTSQSAGQTPSAPAAQPFDPPKQFGALGAFKANVDKKRSTWDPQPGMAKDVALWVDLTGLHGRKLGTPDGFDAPADGTPVVKVNSENPSSPSDGSTPSDDPSGSPSSSGDPSSTSSPGNESGLETIDASAPTAAKLDGKDVVVVAYSQRVLGSGTTKDGAQIRFQWIDPAAGEVVSSADANTTAQTAGEAPAVSTRPIVDAATGLVAVGIGGATAYADPAAKTGGVVPNVIPAGLTNGVVIGALTNKDNDDLGITGVDVKTKQSKFLGLKDAQYIKAAGHGDKHGYFWVERYNQVKKVSERFVYSADAAGKLTATPSTHDNVLARYSCYSETGGGAVVCDSELSSEVLGFDDATGKKSWGWTEKSGGRVVPHLTTIFHGVVYASTENGPALLDAKSGKDLPVPSAPPGETPGTPGAGGSTPGASETPSGGETPTDPMSPGATPSVFGDTFESGNPAYGFSGKLVTPEAVSEYGAVTIRDDFETGPLETGPVAVVLKAIG